MGIFFLGSKKLAEKYNNLAENFLIQKKHSFLHHLKMNNKFETVLNTIFKNFYLIIIHVLRKIIFEIEKKTLKMSLD
jgi:hypothetical protein